MKYVVLLALFGASCGHAQPTGKSKKVAPAVLPKAKPEARPLFDEGVRLMALGGKNLEAARDQLTRAVGLDDKLFEAWHDLGVVEARLGRWEPARDALRKALKLQPASRKTVIALGEVLGRGRRWSEAQSLFADESAAEPTDQDMRLRYVQALRDGGQANQALDQIKAVLAKDSKNAAAFNALGLIYFKMEKLPLAESAFRRAIELDSQAKATAAVWNNLGLVELARGNSQEAFQAFDKASMLDPKYREAHLNEANVYLDCGDYKRAEKQIRKAVDIDPDDPDAQLALGVALRGQKRFDEARVAYERALAVRPNYAPALWNLAVLYMDFQQDKKRARETLTMYRKVAPRDDPKRADADARMKELR